MKDCLNTHTFSIKLALNTSISTLYPWYFEGIIYCPDCLLHCNENEREFKMCAHKYAHTMSENQSEQWTCIRSKLIYFFFKERRLITFQTNRIKSIKTRIKSIKTMSHYMLYRTFRSKSCKTFSLDTNDTKKNVAKFIPSSDDNNIPVLFIFLVHDWNIIIRVSEQWTCLDKNWTSSHH